MARVKTVVSRIEEIYEELVDEHRSIMAVVGQLKQHHTVLHLVPLLEELHSLLVKHFAREQFPGGLYECLGGVSSAYHEALRTLVSEHCSILSSVRGLLERARLASDENASKILGEVAAVVESLEQHEEKEHQLAERALGRLRGESVPTTRR